MPVYFDSKLTLIQIYQYSYQYWKNRWDYMDRDVLKKISVLKVKTYTKDRTKMPLIRYDIITSSYPQYIPYTKVKSKLAKKQRKIKHNYKITLQLETLTLDSKLRWRTGSQKKDPSDNNIPWTKIKQIHSSVREKYKKKYGEGTKEYKEALQKHRKKAKYESRGDYVAKEYGIMLDWYYRIQGNAYLNNMLFGIPWEKDKFGDGIPFFDKHMLRIITVLLKRNIIKRTV